MLWQGCLDVGQLTLTLDIEFFGLEQIRFWRPYFSEWKIDSLSDKGIVFLICNPFMLIAL